MDRGSLSEREDARCCDQQRPPVVDRAVGVEHAGGIEQEQHAERDDGQT